jgi:uncharacterized membrane protein YphA (DoxX/SURF4 family)
MAESAAAAQRPYPKVSGNDRDFLHLAGILNPFRFVRAASKREFMDKLEWVLRLSVALCFIGHGFWGTISKPGWVDLITPMGFSPSTALALLPWIGWADVLLGVLVIYRPRSVLLWKAFLWACFTPLLRPLAGLSWFEVPERAGNYGVPLAFIVLAGGMGLMKTWWNGFEVIDEPESKLSDEVIRKVKLVLQLSVGLLLLGHGGLMAIAQKPVYIQHLQAIGIPATQGLVSILGWVEIAAGVVVMFRPMVPLVWVVFFWKIATESLWPIAGHAVDAWETVERWGDYGGCIALLLILYYFRDRVGSPKPAARAD